MARRNGRMPQLEPWQERLLREKYDGCLSVEDRRELNERLGWGDDPQMGMLYNAASGLGVTCGRGHEPSALAHGTPFPTAFTERDDAYIKSAWPLMAVERIARQRDYSLAAILYRARQLGCRKAAAYWPLERLAQSLRLPMDEIRRRDDLERWQLDNGRWVVGSCSLVRWFMHEWDELVAGGADEHLLHEVLESYHELMDMQLEYERCKYLSPEHICMNPHAGLQFGHSCSQIKRTGGYEAGENPKCAVRNEPFGPQPLMAPSN